MKRTVFILALLTAVSFTFTHAEAEELKKLTFEQAYLGKGEKLLKPLPQLFGWADDKHYYQMDKGKLFKVSAKSGKRKQVLDPAKYKETLQSIGKHVSFMGRADRTNDFNKFLFLNKGDIFLFIRDKNKVLQVTKTKGEEKIPRFSPDGSKIAYTLDGNLHVYHLVSQKTRQLTKDGSKKILNGYASWVYFEEVFGRASRYKAFWWSPDSSKIVFMRFDQSQVPVFSIVSSKGIYGHLEQTHFPKAGYPNPNVKLGIAHINKDKNIVRWIDVKDEKDHYLAFPQWNSSSKKIYFQWKNRDQDHIKILRYDLDSGTIQTVYQEKQKTWVDFFGEIDFGIFKQNDFFLLKNGDLIIRSSKDGWHHLYYIQQDGKENQLTSGEWFVFTINHIDEKRHQVYFTAAMGDSTGRDLYKTDFKGEKIEKLTHPKGLHLVTVSPGGSYFTDRYSSLNTPTRIELRKTNGKLIRKLGDSYSPKMEEYALAKVELFKIKTDDGYHLPALWFLPPNFDKTKKYPVIIQIYGGPGAPTVLNRFIGLRDHFKAQQGIIVMSVDHRGSGHFGKKGVDLMYRNFGKWEMHDYIQAVKYLRTLPFVESQKIGITGGSYGGYVTALALTYGSDYFQYGIARAPGFDWKLYDTIYTEKYMDTPKDNPEGYENSSVFKYIDQYKGNIRITHGSLDDNAHMQATLQFIDKMQEAGKTFELMVYPGERHGYRGKKRIASYKGDLNFWMKHFFGKTLFK